MSMTGIRLTARGLMLALGGIAVVVTAAILGEPDLAWIGVFLLALPLIGLVLVTLTRPHLRAVRTVSPHQSPIGGAPRASLHIRNTQPLSLSSLEFMDVIPAELGQSTQFNFTRGLGRWNQSVGYPIPATRRGLFTIGPLKVRAHDPFGTTLASWKVRSEPTSIRITPRIWDLTAFGGSKSQGASSESTPHRIGTAGQDDVLVREHRHGDDIRRIHWGMTAKQGELMVRLEEHPWDPTLTLVVDNRSVAHFGDGPDSTLEWCISATASIASQVLRNRQRATIVSAETVIFTPTHADIASQESMIRALTDLNATAETGLHTALSDWEALTSSHSLVACLGLLTHQDAAVLCAVGIHMRYVMAVVPDAAAWGASQEQYDAHRDACRLLLSNGWQVRRYRPGQQVPDVVSELGAVGDAT